MNEILATVLCTVGYILIGLGAARGVFEYYCRYRKPSYHRMSDNHPYHQSRDQVHWEMFIAFLAWPICLVLLTGFGLKNYWVKVLTSNPPAPHDIAERLEISKERTAELEEKTGVIHYSDSAIIDKYRNGGIL